jgi:DNA-binding transcriptional ArsR family regulator
LQKLAHGEKTITELAEPFSMSLAAVSKHIKVLETAKLVQRRREGSFSYLSLDSEGMVSADKWIAYYRKFWQGQLGSLKKFVEQGEK